MFMAVARKAGEATKRRNVKPRRQIISTLQRQDTEELARWVQSPEQMCFFTAGEMLYGCRREHFADIESLSGVLSVIYSGVAMGQIFKKRLKPDGALATYVGFNRSAVPQCEVSEEDSLRFLRKQDMAAEPFSEGLNVVVFQGQTLGFVKRIGARVNNMYSNSLRILK